ncbi:MAG: M23 family metallopeptidase [Gemmatimonadota bacterium]
MSGSDWFIVMTREGGTSSRRFRLDARRTGIVAAVAGLLVLAAVAWGGYRVGLADARGDVRTMEARADSLAEENAKVVALAARLEEIEGAYERLRSVMGGEVTPSARDILLPPSRAETERGRDETEATADRSRPILWPLVESGFVTRSFGDSVPGEGPHPGLDIAVPVGSYVRSSGAGVVVEAANDDVYGRFVRLEHADGFRSLYAHNSWTFVGPGDSVEAGEVIALSGNTGRSTAPHLHLEIERGDERVDPLPFVSDRL